MAEINTPIQNGSKRTKSTTSKVNLRVDFTPMVDMNMLIITFFMFCTTLASPQVMDIVMPTKKADVQEPTLNPESKTITLLLDKDHKIYYYLGIPNYNDPNTLKITNIQHTGLRNLLLERNAETINKIQTLKIAKARKEITEKQFKQQISDLKMKKGGQLVVIKPTDMSSYSDLVATLDEMQICGISKYAVVDLEMEDKLLLDKFISKEKFADAIR